MIIRRAAHPYLANELRGASRNVLVIGGARQVGKTTLIREVLREFPEHIELNLETDRILLDKLERTQSFAEFETLLKLEKGFDRSRTPILFIDEAQESSRLGDYVRSLKEEWGSTRTVLSGSSMTRLFGSEQRIPVGRITTLTVYPFTFEEFLRARGREPLLEFTQDAESAVPALFHQELLDEVDRYLNIGGLPAVVLAAVEGVDYAVLRRSIFLAQQDDFVRKSAIKDPALFADALRGIAVTLGFPSKLAQISPSYYQAKKIASALSRWQLAVEIEQRGLNSTSEFLPKRYLYDLGIAQLLRNMPLPKLSALKTINPALRSQLGGLVENAALLNLLPYKMGNAELSSWKKSNKEQIEVDFVWRTESGVLPIECKAATRITPRSHSSLKHYLTATGTSVGVIVSLAPPSEARHDKKRFVNLPLYRCTPQILNSLF